ncbi:hypothetical protein BY996DRAFT_6620655 [Phakopsora pachyrhizi]|nr:hypothetical protein BY996DRAFT_6620655 [Phakopsora pachyrhizi]
MSIIEPATEYIGGGGEVASEEYDSRGGVLMLKLGAESEHPESQTDWSVALAKKLVTMAITASLEQKVKETLGADRLEDL